MNYNPVKSIVSKSTASKLYSFSSDRILYELVNMWVSDYSQKCTHAMIVEITTNNKNYLFDQTASHLIAAWAFSEGKSLEKRDKARMARYPMVAGKLFHRGHSIPHCIGGGTDINLVIQRGSLNIGEFRALEKKAAAYNGALYFTYWIYSDNNSMKPSGVHQGLLSQEEGLVIRKFNN